jgi:tetratricopeptide (TPR) repeat protein
MSTESILDVFGVLEGTDKSSLGHGYLQYYEEFLRPIRHERFVLVEIGIFGGASLRCWKSYFPNAQIIGIDIDANCKRHEEERIRIEIGSQDDPEFIDKVVQKERPLVVIDDGSHRAHHMIATFERIFPALLPGGYYIFEDAYMHYQQRREEWHTGLARVPFKEYCANLATSKASGWIDPASDFGIGKYIFEQAATVTYLHQAVMVRKRHPPPDTAAVLRAAEQVAVESGLAVHWLGLASMVLTRKGDPKLAEAAARRAVEVGDRSWRSALYLCQALERQDRMDDGIVVAQQGLAKDPGAFKLLEWIANVYSARGDHARAAEYYRRAVIADPDQPWFHLHLSRSLVQLGELDKAMESAEQAERLIRGAPPEAGFTAQGSCCGPHRQEIVIRRFRSQWPHAACFQGERRRPG